MPIHIQFNQSNKYSYVTDAFVRTVIGSNVDWEDIIDGCNETFAESLSNPQVVNQTIGNNQVPIGSEVSNTKKQVNAEYLTEVKTDFGNNGIVTTNLSAFLSVEDSELDMGPSIGSDLLVTISHVGGE